MDAKPRFVALGRKGVLISMNSHGIPSASDESGTEGQQDPKQKTNAGFIQALRFIRTQRSGARASRHPPRWRAQLDTPQSGTRAAG